MYYKGVSFFICNFQGPWFGHVETWCWNGNRNGKLLHRLSFEYKGKEFTLQQGTLYFAFHKKILQPRMTICIRQLIYRVSNVSGIEPWGRSDQLVGSINAALAIDLADPVTLIYGPSGDIFVCHILVLKV